MCVACYVNSDVGGRSVHQRNRGNYIQERRRRTCVVSGAFRICSEPRFRYLHSISRFNRLTRDVYWETMSLKYYA